MKTIVRFVFRALLGFSVMSAIVLIVAWLTGQTPWIGPALAGSLVGLALIATLREEFRSVTFTVWIAAGVAVGMAFPQWFLGIGNFRFTALFVPILQVIMFGMGTTLSLTDFTRVFKMPGGILMGVACQFTIMPLLGYVLAHTFALPPEVAAGLVLVGVSPSGLASNVMAYIAKANLAMSVTMTAATTLLAPILTPLLMQWLAGEMIEIDVFAMMVSMAKIVLLPVIGGLVFHHLFYHRYRWLDRVMPIVSMLGIFAMTILTVAAGRDNLLQMGLLLVVACFIHTTLGFVLGYWVCRAIGMDQITCRTISLEVGLQNAGMASGIAAELNKVATLGLAPIVFGPIMNMTASTIANWWRNHPVVVSTVSPSDTSTSVEQSEASLDALATPDSVRNA